MKRQLIQFVLIIKFTLAFMIILFSNPASAQPPQKGYTLDELYGEALVHAEKIGIAKEAVAIARYTRKQALSVLIPTVTAFGNYHYFSEEKIAEGAVIQPQWDSSYGITLGQSLTLNGRELTALRIAEQGIKKSKFDLDTAKESYLYSVATAFFDVAKAKQAVQIAEANKTRLTTYKKAVSTRLRLGDVPKTALFRTEAELASAGADLLKAKNLQKLSRAFLARLTGVSPSFGIEESEVSLQNLGTTELDKLKQMADNNRPELKSFAVNANIAENRVKYMRGAYWPRLRVEGSWTALEQEPDPLLDQSASVGATLTFDIFDGGLRRAQTSESRSQQKQAQLSLSDAKRSVAVEVEEAYLNWQTQQSIIKSFESRLRYAEENYEASARLFQNGMANSVDVMDANTLLVTAEWQLAEARYNLQLATLGLERATGVFLSTIENRLKH